MKILITGTNGFLGIRALRYLSCQNACLAPDHQNFDLTNVEMCRDFIEEKQPDVVLHLAAISEIPECEKNPELSKKVNLDGPINLAQICKEKGIRFIFASSDQVYTGSKTTEAGTEKDDCHPTNVYAQHKYLAEQQILSILPDAIGLRFSWMYDLPDRKLKVKSNFSVNLLNSLIQQKPQYFSDQCLRSVTYSRFVIENIVKIIDLSNFPGGIYNFGSPANGNFFEFCQEAYRVAGEFKKMPWENLCLKAEEKSFENLSMDQTKLNQNGIYFPDPLEGFELCFRDHDDKRR